MFNVKKSSPGKIMMTLASICFCLVLISTSMMSGLYAKYVVKDSGSDSARVIRFYDLKVTESGDFQKLESGAHQFIFIPGVPLEKNVEISFGGSEAATIVFVEVDAPSWNLSNKKDFTDLKRNLSWSVADGWEYLESNGTSHVYYKLLEPNDSFKNAKFIKDSRINVDPDGTVEIYSTYPETKFIVKGYAVQANGFKSVGEAWDSLSAK